MKASSAVHATLLLSVFAACFALDGSRNRITVRKYRSNYRIDSWDDNRDDPYRVTFWKFGLKSVYTFDTSGNIKTLTARDTLYTFDSAVGRRTLVGLDDDDIMKADIDPVNAISCTDCQATWTAVCGVGISDVCFLDENPIDDFDEDGIDSVRRMCSGFGAACESSAFDACDGQCTEDETDPAPTPAPVEETTPAPMVESTPAPVAEATPAPMAEATLVPAAEEITLAPMAEEETSAPMAEEVTPAPIVEEVTPAPMVEELTPAPTVEMTQTPIGEVTLAPSTQTGKDECSPNPCENDGQCAVDPAGGYVCSCASGYGGMACQTDTSALDSFYIELAYVGNWTDARQNVVQTAADRWAKLITHVPCGGAADYPAGRLLITSTLEEIDGVDGVLGFAGPSNVWGSCNTISAVGYMAFDIDDIDSMEDAGVFETVILHEMGHVIGVGTLWGVGYGECTTCKLDNSPAWTCSAAVSAYSDIGGADADIIELDGEDGTACVNLDQDIFGDELMTGYISNTMYLSKITAAILDDLNYIVDPSEVDAYTLPSVGGVESGTLAGISDTAVETTIRSLDDDGNVLEEVAGIGMVF